MRYRQRARTVRAIQWNGQNGGEVADLFPRHVLVADDHSGILAGRESLLVRGSAPGSRWKVAWPGWWVWQSSAGDHVVLSSDRNFRTVLKQVSPGVYEPVVQEAAAALYDRLDAGPVTDLLGTHLVKQTRAGLQVISGGGAWIMMLPGWYAVRLSDGSHSIYAGDLFEESWELITGD